ncbi:formate/nitrite transporter family protein [Bacillus sp. 2205SS5-2]|uniref:formate/nitrite transporter family protein n=1 Tax=Bacillus sp. 2205SS5-2 TaxID=3109031 RepID=UPI0030064F22
MNDGIRQCTELALKKKRILEGSVVNYLVRAALAGVYIGFAIILCFKLGESFRLVDSPAIYLMTSIFFGIALLLIIYGDAELFTGNTMYFSISTLRKETSWRDLVSNWLACYCGNILGALFFTAIFIGTGLFSDISENHLLFYFAEKKMHGTTLELVFRSILCNWLVCLAIWIPMQLKGDGAKVMAMMLLVFTFFLSGYEHSIANFVLFSLALALPHPETITFAGMVHNILPVTIGNIIGGAVFMGALYTFLSSPAKRKDPALVVVKEPLFHFPKLKRN